MKKLVSLALALIMVLALGSTALAYSPEKPITIQFWHNRGSGANLDATVQAVDDFNATIGKEKGIFVEEIFQGGYADIVPKLEMASQSGGLPAVGVTSGVRASILLDDGLLADMAPYAAKTGFDFSVFFESLLDVPGNENGEIRSLPYVRSTPVFYYNKTMADAKGLKAPETVAELEAFAKALNTYDPATGEYGVNVVEIPGSASLASALKEDSTVENLGEIAGETYGNLGYLSVADWMPAELIH